MTRLLLVALIAAAVCMVSAGVGAADRGLYRRLYDHNHKND